MDEDVPEFPQYPPANPGGLQVAHPTQYKPLAKMMKFMLRPKKTFKAPKAKLRWKRRQPYY